jgi:DNA-binding MarR family transcriptional regulator
MSAKPRIKLSEAAERDPPLKMEVLGATMGFMVRVVQVQIFQAYYERFGKTGLTTGEFSALAAIRENPGVRQGALASAMMIKRSNMTKLVQSLEREGLILRRAAEDDARSVNLELTVKGRRALDKVLPDIEAFNRDVTQALSAPERQVLLGLLGKLSENLHGRG